MSWRDCIATAVETGRITPDRGEEAYEAFDRAFEQATADGMEEGAAMLAAADAAVEEITTLKKAKRWERINTMQRAHKIFERLMASKKPWEELEAIINDTEYAFESVQSFLMANLDQLLLKYKPKAGGLRLPTDNLDNIVRASYGDVRNSEAAEMFDALAEMQENARKWANMHGANIPENPNRRIPQTQDAVKVSAVDEDVWVRDHMDSLDWEVMRYEGKAIPAGKREEVLRRTYQGIRSDGASRGLEAQGNQTNLAGRLNRDRFLYYKDADSYLAMMNKYGAGNLYEQTICFVDAMAKDISLLRVFGPSPDSMREYTKRVALKRADDLDAEKGANQRKILSRTRRQTEVFDDEFEIHSRHTPSLDGNLPMQTFSAVRTVAVGAKLGGVLIPSMAGDLANARAARAMFNLPTARVMRNYFRDFVPSKESLQQAIRAGVIFENGISLAHSRQRYFGSLDGPHWARRFSDITYRMGLAAHHTQIIRNSEGKQFMGILADHRRVAFDDLPFAAMLSERGITPADWDVMRRIPLHKFQGAAFLRPIDAFESSPEVSEKFSDLMQMYIRTAVPDVTLRTRRAMGEHIDPNSFWGQSVRTFGSLASFPVSVYFNQLRRISNAPTVRDKITLGAKYFVWMTLGGMFITQTKALLSGKELYSMDFTDADNNYALDFYGRSVLNGGSLGILGDLVFNNINISNSTYRPGNPTEEYFKAAHKLTLDNLIDAFKGEELEVGKDLYKFIDQNVPDLFYISLLWDRAVGDELMQQVDPRGYAARRRYEQEHEEGTWWGMGEEASVPNLATAVGE